MTPAATPDGPAPSVTMPEAVALLVQRFSDNRDAYQAAHYNETQTRREFIDPLFKALGWDIDNESGYAEAYKDVVHEDAVKVGRATKAPDYSFRIGGARKFFLEAKKPAINIKDDPEPAFQLRRYAWSAGLSLSVLTNFSEFALYDCRIKPAASDKASVGRVLYVTCGEYAKRWADIASILSKSAVLKGSFDRYAAGRKRRGTAEVDAAFLAEIEGWRDTLARNIALRNPNLSQRDLNFAVGRTIDRIIFLRICEDRGIERYGELQTLLNGERIYQRLFERFQRADERYNSGLFHFSHEKGRASNPDELTPHLDIDDAALKDIFKGLYYPQSPYEFSVMPAEILGQVYEQFLGKVIRLTVGHRAVVEDKPEVRKAGGVYYTPSYIVDYIVQHTVGALLGDQPRPAGDAMDAGNGDEGIADEADAEPKTKSRERQYNSRHITPENAAQLKVLDPACGSGSFLLGAYQYLLDWHLRWYLANGAEKHAKGRNPKLRQTGNGNGGWKLTTAERKRILLNNIFGVDIDAQAVEVTKLSLLLKVLEGESEESLERQRTIFRERALPDLSSNIKCGNSLIGPDFYKGRQNGFFDDEDEQLRINAFDWQVGFPDAFKGKNPGFDAVIGNPPYVLLQDAFRDDVQGQYFRSRYTVASYKLDTYHFFIERFVKLANAGGLCALITPANYLTNNHLAPLRRFLAKTTAIDHVLVIEGGVFPRVSVDNAVLVARKGERLAGNFWVVHASVTEGPLRQASREKVVLKTALKDPHVLFTGHGKTAMRGICEKVERSSVELGTIARVNFGKQLRDRKAHPKDIVTVTSIRKINRAYRPCYAGKNVTRYSLQWEGLACRDNRMAQCGGCWDPGVQNAKNKLLTRQIGRFPEFALDTAGYQCLNTIFMVTMQRDDIDPCYVLGVLNSRLLRWFWLQRYYDRRRTFPKIKGTYLKKLPIRLPEQMGSERHNRIVSLVKRILAMHERLSTLRTPHEKTVAERSIDATDREIDELVYELYGLTKAEIAVVEEAMASE